MVSSELDRRKFIIEARRLCNELFDSQSRRLRHLYLNDLDNQDLYEFVSLVAWVNLCAIGYEAGEHTSAQTCKSIMRRMDQLYEARWQAFPTIALLAQKMKPVREKMKQEEYARTKDANAN